MKILFAVILLTTLVGCSSRLHMCESGNFESFRWYSWAGGNESKCIPCSEARTLEEINFCAQLSFLKE